MVVFTQKKNWKFQLCLGSVFQQGQTWARQTFEKLCHLWLVIWIFIYFLQESVQYQDKAVCCADYRKKNCFVVLEAEFQLSRNSVLLFWGECVAFFTALNSGPPLSNCCGNFFSFLYQSAHIAWSGRITRWWKEDFNIHIHSIFDVFVVDPIDFSVLELGFIKLFSTKNDHDLLYLSWFVKLRTCNI